jgi:hypothetical protein
LRIRQNWTDTLERHLEELGLGRSGVAADAVGRLQRGGVREEELRGGGAERLLRELGVPLGARRAILTYYRGGDGRGLNGSGDDSGSYQRSTGGWGVDSLVSVNGGASQVAHPTGSRPDDDPHSNRCLADARASYLGA